MLINDLLSPKMTEKAKKKLLMESDVTSKITHMGVGNSNVLSNSDYMGSSFCCGYTPDEDVNYLRNERDFFDIYSVRVSNDSLNISGSARGKESYWINEVGLYLSDGTLFSVYSDPDNYIGFMSAGNVLDICFDAFFHEFYLDRICHRNSI